MQNIREKTLARLSIAALAVDIMVVTLIVIGTQSAIKQYLNPAPQWLILAVIPVMLALHFLIVDILAGGLSIGRLSTGLMLRDQKTGGKPSFASSIKRCISVLFSLGLPSLNPQSLPKYNKRQDRCMCSDWVGSAEHSHVSSPASAVNHDSQGGQGLSSKQDTKQLGLQVVSGPNNGILKRFMQGKSFAKNSMFIVGRDTKLSDIVLADDKSVSSVQFRVALRNGRLLIIDGKSSTEASRYGTLVNGKKISNTKPSVLRLGDFIKIGQTTLKVI